MNKRHRKNNKTGLLINYFDKYMYFIAIIMPLTTLTQTIEIWSKKSAANVSLLTWSAYVLSAISWIAYSIIHKEKILILNSSLWLVLNFSVALGIVLYQ